MPERHPVDLEEDMQKDVLRTKEAARYLGLAQSTLAKMRLRGNGPTYCKAGPRIVVYRQSDLDAWLESRLRRSTSEPVRERCHE